MTGKLLRIGTRESELAAWQARIVLERLQHAGYTAELCFIKTEGDRVLDTPLPLMGGKGVFTKALDDALLAGEIDLAVHSLKDIPTRLPDGLALGAVTEREDAADVLVARDAARIDFLNDAGCRAVIASSSNRRIGQWLARYPLHLMTDIRGNVQTRLRKLAESSWDGAIFAAAGLIRLGLQQHISLKLDWMLPAPAQGAMGVMVRQDDRRIHEAVQLVHDPDVALCTGIERDVLHYLEGGCSAPVGALAVVTGGLVRLRVNTVYPDGTGLVQFEMEDKRDRAADLGKRAADEALALGADALIRDLKGGKQNKDKMVHAGMPPSHIPSKEWTKQSSELAKQPSITGEKSSKRGKQSSNPIRIVISTRLADSGDVSLAREHHIRLLDYPAWLYRWLTPSFPVTRSEAWAFTSRRGVEGWWRTWKSRGADADAIPPVYAISEATAGAVRQRFPDAEIRLSSYGDGMSLGEAMARDGIRSAVHFCAADRRQELMQVSRKYSIHLAEVEVYERCRVQDPKPLNVAFDAILFFSPDGVSEFCRIYEVPGGEWQAIAIGKTTADAVRRVTGREPRIPAAPAFQEMIKLV